MPTRHARLNVALRRVRRAHQCPLYGAAVGAHGAPYACGWWALVSVVVVAMSPSVAAQPFYAPPSGVRVEGVPPIPQSLVDRAAPYTQFRASTLLDWHPNQRAALILLPLRDGDGSEQLHLVAAPTASPQPLSNYPGVMVDASFEPERGEFVLFRSYLHNSDARQIFRLNLATRKVTAVSPVGASASMPAWSKRGERIAFFATVKQRQALPRPPLSREATQTKLYLGDPRAPEGIEAMATFDGGEWHDVRFSPDDRSLVYVGRDAAGSAVWTLDIATQISTRMTRNATVDVTYRAPQFTPDGKGIIMIVGRTPTRPRIEYLDLASGDTTVLTGKLNAEVIEFALSAVAKRIAVNSIEDGTSVLRFFDLESKIELPRPALLAGEIVGVRWHQPSLDADNAANTNAGFELGFSLATPRAPREVFVYDVKTTKLTRWTNGAVASLNAFAFVEPTRVSWKGADGKHASGQLWAPDASTFVGKRPVIVRFEVDAAARRSLGFLGHHNFLINESGIAILYADADASVALLDWIRLQPTLDEKRVMVWGTGAGGALARSMLASHANRIVGGIIDASVNGNGGNDGNNGNNGDNGDAGAMVITRPLFVVERSPRVLPFEQSSGLAPRRESPTGIWRVWPDDRALMRTKSIQDFVFYAQLAFIETIIVK